MDDGGETAEEPEQPQAKAGGKKRGGKFGKKGVTPPIGSAAHAVAMSAGSAGEKGGGEGDACDQK